MNEEFRLEVIAEIEAFRADLRRRTASTFASDRPGLLDEPAETIGEIDGDRARALISARYAEARRERRLAEIERRLEALEAARG